MMFSNKKLKPSVCPKTGKTIEQKSNFRWLRWLFPITGLLALLWFLIRVIPKPSRATYPCQRVAFPLASGLIIWIMGLLGSVTAYRKAQKYIAKARYTLAFICIVISIGFIWIASNSTDENPAYAHEPIVVNSPLGQAKGIFPGRVAWIHDLDATSWEGSDGDTTGPFWHENVCTDQMVVNKMLSKALRALTGRSNDAEAWDAIFKNFNQQMSRGYVGYTSGEKIAIKVNFVLMYSNPSNGEKPAFLRDQIDNSPQLAIALLKQLIDTAGVSPDDISIGDPLMIMPNHWYNMVHAECPGVVYLSKSGYSLTGRTQVSLDYNAPFYWSDPITSRVSGKTQDYIPTHFAQSDYFINFPVLKSHNDGGITLSGKNHFGSLMRVPNASGYYDMHYTRATETPGMGHYRAIVDLLGHPKLGGKTMLTLIDGLYSGRSWDSHPIRWDMAPFNGDWPSSIFLSQDPVAADSVAFDFMDNEWDASPSNINGYPQKSGADDYLHEAALIPNPPSGANYNPNHDGGLTKSLGVHEHWNNATEKQYSRNLDPVNGTGIELVTEPSVVGDVYRDGVVDFKDFAVFAAAWGSQPGDDNWNVACDISTPSDGIIDELDLAVFCDDWVNVLVTCLVQPGAMLQEVYSASGIFFEGPTWDPASNKLFFSRRTGIYQILRLDSPGSVTVWMNNSPQTNGTFLSLDGRLLTADENPRQISSHRIDPGGPGDSQILADSSDGFSKKPNDLCQLANGNIYFTTPDWGADPGSQGVYLLEPDGTVTLVKNGLYQPNGVIASLDGTKLYVAESSNSFNPSREQWWVFNIKTDGILDAGSVFFKPASPPNPSNVPDGMTIDELGNLYFSGLGGIWIVSPQGELLEFISVPQSVSNVTFGGPNGRTLYMTCQDKVYSLDMCVRGGRPYLIPIPSHYATNPNPYDGQLGVSTTPVLSWTADPGATSHDVYFGTSSPGTFQGNQTATMFDPGTLNVGATYYWRIDEVGAYGTITGVVWSFTTLIPSHSATNPNPPNGAVTVNITAELSWTADPDATSHDVYFGTSNPPPFIHNQAATTFDPGTMEYSTTYYWRIDELGAYGTIPGQVWNFTTIMSPPPPP